VPGVEHREAALPEDAHPELRDHAFAKAPWLLASSDEEREALPQSVKDEPHGRWSAQGGGRGHRPDVLWSCTNCGACVEQCPVDIEHIDHIVDMRRYQTMIESSFPSEAGGMLKNLEKAGNPWACRLGCAPSGPRPRLQGAGAREDVEDASELDYLFWVGCAGSLDDKAQKTTKAVAELLNIAGVLRDPRPGRDVHR